MGVSETDAQILNRTAGCIGELHMDRFYQIHDTILPLPGVNGHHILWHISDTHIAAVDAQSTPEEAEIAWQQEKIWQNSRRYFTRAFSEPFYPEHEIPSTGAFQKLIQGVDARTEAILLSGDILDYPHRAGVRFVRSQLTRTPIKTIYAPGNHDNILNAGVCAEDPIPGYYAGEDIVLYHADGFIVAALDDSRKSISEKQYRQWKALCSEGLPIVLLMHIPFLTVYNMAEMASFDGYYLLREEETDEITAQWIRECMEPTNPTAAILCGHVHGFRTSFFAPGKQQICASSGLVGFVDRVSICGTEDTCNI